MRIAWAPISSAAELRPGVRRENGLPVPAAKMTIRPFSRCRIARRRMYGSATSDTVIADCTRVWTPSRSSASWSVNAFQERRQHPGVVRGRAVHALGGGEHAAIDVPRTDDDRELGPRVVHGEHLADRDDGVGIDAVLAPASTEESFRSVRPGAGVSVETLAVAVSVRAVTVTETRVNRTTDALPSSSACPTVFDASWIHACSARTARGSREEALLQHAVHDLLTRRLGLRLHLVGVEKDRALLQPSHPVRRRARSIPERERDVHRDLTGSSGDPPWSSTRTPILFAGG